MTKSESWPVCGRHGRIPNNLCVPCWERTVAAASTRRPSSSSRPKSGERASVVPPVGKSSRQGVRMTAGGAKERDITRAVRDLLRALGIPHFKVHGHLGQERGVPDIIGCLPPHGKMVAIEVKGSRGRVTDAQREWLARYEAAGAVTGVVRSVEDVIELLEQGGYAVREKLLLE